MRICAISPRMGQALEALGHDVRIFWPEDTDTFDLPAALEREGFEPELVFQQESLGRRVLLKGLETLDCPTIFWSVDTHVNLFWHLPYARLFDGVMTPHVSLWQAAHKPVPPVARLAWPGLDRPWRPHADRAHPVAFVGRMTEHRPARTRMVAFLRDGYGAAVASDIGYEAMQALYLDARLGPNDTLSGEVNFRLLETASCGCLPLTPDIGPDQDVLFAKGKEAAVFAHGLELKALLDYYTAHPEAAETMARAAWERVQREHLVRHRAQAILDFAVGLSKRPLSGRAADASLAQTSWLLFREGRSRTRHAALAAQLAEYAEDTPANAAWAHEALAALVGLLAEMRSRDLLRPLLLETLAQERFADRLDVNCAGSGAALRLGDTAMARQYWLRHHRRFGKDDRVNPQSPVDICLAWAEELRHRKRATFAGMLFDPDTSVPASALDWCLLAQTLEPANNTARRLAATMLSRARGYDQMRLGLLSHLHLRDRGNWRMGMELGMLDLRANRIKEGLEEILVVRETAAAKGQERAFDRALAGMDPGGAVAQALRALRHGDAV